MKSDVLVDELLQWRKNVTCMGQGCYISPAGTGVAQGRDDGGLYDKVTGFHAEEDGDNKKKIKFCYVGANVTVPKADLDLAKIVPQYEEFRDAAAAQNKKAADEGLEVDMIGATGNAMWIANMAALVECVVQVCACPCMLVGLTCSCDWAELAVVVFALAGPTVCVVLVRERVRGGREGGRVWYVCVRAGAGLGKRGCERMEGTKCVPKVSHTSLRSILTPRFGLRA